MKLLSLSLCLIGLTSLSLNAQDVMTPETLWNLGRVSLDDANEHAVIYGVTNYDLDENKGNRNLYMVNKASGEVTQLTDLDGGEYQAFFFRGGQSVGFLYQDQLHSVDPRTGEIKALTAIEGGVSDAKCVELKEGRLVMAFVTSVSMEKTPLERRPHLPMANYAVYDELMYRHWNQWTDYQFNHIAVAVIDPLSDQPVTEMVDIMAGEAVHAPMPPFGGSESFDISPDGRFIAYASKKSSSKLDFATSTDSKIYLHDRTSHVTATVHGLDGYDNNPQFSPDGQWLAFTAMAEDGYESDINQLYIVASDDAGKVQTLDPVMETEYVSEFQWLSNSSIVYRDQHEATQHIHRLDLLKGKRGLSKQHIVDLTSGDYNYGHFIAKGKHVVAQRQDMNHANELYLFSSKKASDVQALTHVNDSIYDALDLCKVEKRWIPTSDGGSMLTWVIYPPHFDASKTYPTLLYCQGGPQSPVSQFYSFRWNFQLMASQGYIVVAPNRHGVPSFGKAWNEQISGDWGGQAMEDYLAAIDTLAKEPYVDKANLGAVGASYGGYSVYMLAGIHENRFAALISHCGLFDMKSWYLSTEEMFFANKDLGGPFWQDNEPLSYSKHNPINYVQHWTSPLLVIHGANDFRVPVNQGMEAFQAAQLRGIPSRFLYFPEEGHWVQSPQNGLVWHDEFFGWLKQWLKD
ncbi:MAG: S9 family peptidase [Schleiferiaceae bacterium]|nr:S9 family peptidase [Schleiferiaceae bacterium]MDG1220579.1 S9 family peptidase [Schleiferiaceae bacterium]